VSVNNGSSDIENPAKRFVRDFLRPHLGAVPDTKFFLFSSGGGHYASAAKRVPGIEGLVELHLKPISQRQYGIIAGVYGDSIVEVDSALEFRDREEVYANYNGKSLGSLTEQQIIFLQNRFK